MRNLYSLLLVAGMVLVTPLFPNAQINDAIKFRITDPNGHSDETILRLHANATSGFDADWDAWKLFTTNNAYPSIYSKTCEGWDEAINSFGYPQGDTTVGLMIRALETSGSYSMDVEFQGNFTFTTRVGIRDVVTGDSFILAGDISFSFDVIASPSDVQRFEVFFSPTATVAVTDNHATVTNSGADNWTCQLFADDWTELDNVPVSSDSTVFDNLDNADYIAVCNDAFGFSDTLYFTITSAAGSSAIPEKTGDTALNFRSVGRTGYLTGIFDSPKRITILVYSCSGSLLETVTYPAAQSIDYCLVDKGYSTGMILVTAIVDDEKQTWKLVLN